MDGGECGYRTPRYLTFKQALALGGHVRKGEHGTKVYFVKRLQVADREGEENETRIVPMMREYTVFNIGQCEGLPAHVLTPGEVKVRNTEERDPTIDDFLARSGASIREGYRGSLLSSRRRFMSLPRFEAFNSAAHFYRTAFHELAHCTGRKSCLDPISVTASAKKHTLPRNWLPNCALLSFAPNSRLMAVKARRLHRNFD